MEKKTKKKTTAKTSVSPSRSKKESLIGTNELTTLLQEIRSYVTSLTHAHEETKRSVETVLGRFDAITSKLESLEKEVHRTIYGHSERISALEQKAA